MNPNIQNRQIHGQNIVACIWDFDKTLIPGYMQKPLFDYFNVDENVFWTEVNQLPELYSARGMIHPFPQKLEYPNHADAL